MHTTHINNIIAAIRLRAKKLPSGIQFITHARNNPMLDIQKNRFRMFTQRGLRGLIKKSKKPRSVSSSFKNNTDVTAAINPVTTGAIDKKSFIILFLIINKKLKLQVIYIVRFFCQYFFGLNLLGKILYFEQRGEML